MEVNYRKLSEQYASFLAAIGGVSITVLTLVLTFDTISTDTNLRPFLVAALVVATVSCFTGAHMMADTAAFIGNPEGTSSGERLFLLASTNIFVAIILVLFALMLLPVASGKVGDPDFKLFSVWVFGLVVLGTIGWLVRAAIYRVPPPDGGYTIAFIAIVGVVWFLILWFYLIPKGHLLWATFIPIVIVTVAVLLFHTWTFKNGGDASSQDIRFFGSAITISYVSLIIAGIKTMFGPLSK